MMFRMRLLVVGLLAMFCVAHGSSETVLLEDDFSAYPSGLMFDVVGAELEYQYLPIAAPTGHWTVSTFKSSPASQRGWRIVRENGESRIAQMYSNRSRDYHMMLSAGDPAWTDYSVDVRFTLKERRGWAGIAVRYRNDRCLYFAGIEQDVFVLSILRHGTEFRKLNVKRLAEAPLAVPLGEEIRMAVTVMGSRITAAIEDGPTLEAEDGTFSSGGVALIADGLASFGPIRVTTDEDTARAIQDTIDRRTREEAQLQAANPKMKLWKRFLIKDYGVGRNVRFGDLDGDGQVDMLFGQMLHHGPKDRRSELSCLTAVTLDGKVLWQIGEPDVWKYRLTNDVAFQVHDLDGDGRNEVVYCMNQELVVADGATGQTKRKVQTPLVPDNTPAPYNKFPRLLGDAMFFCDLRGTGRDADIIVKDRYLNYWAYNDRLEPLWQGQCVTGHYPYAADVDQDGKDEVALGYSLIDDDGRVLWRLDGQIKDHGDGVAIVSMRMGEAPRIICAASDEGLLVIDLEGNILQHEHLGHVQNPAIGNFRPDLPGLELITVNFWGNQGIFHFFDAEGNLYHDFEPGPHGSLSLPTNWRGDGAEFFILSPNPEWGGLYNGWGRRAVRFPADGHPDMCVNVLDVTGDCRDEIVVWDPYEVWIYTQDDNPRKGRLYEPVRNPLYTESNYRAAVSLPGWSE